VTHLNVLKSVRGAYPILKYGRRDEYSWNKRRPATTVLKNYGKRGENGLQVATSK
jgi:hypothetical protein